MAEIVRVTCHESPGDSSTHWTTRSLAKRFGIGKDSIARVWADHNLKPWRVETFKLSNDPRFEEKLVDVVGLYLNPPISTRRRGPWCSASTRKPNARRWTAPSRACRWSPAAPAR